MDVTCEGRKVIGAAAMTTGPRRAGGAALAFLIATWATSPIEVVSQDRWRLSAAPTVVIGATDDLPSTTFHDVRGVISIDDSLLVVADGGSTELRVFSTAGRFIRSFGGAGDGPTEFRWIAWIDTCGGENIVAYDSFRDRITKWDTHGTLVDEFVVEGPRTSMPPYRVSCGPSGKFAVIGWPDVAAITRRPGPYRPRVPIGIADERGRREYVIGDFPGAERLRTARNDRPHPFGKSTVARLGVAGVYVGTADSFAIHLITPTGERRTFGREHPIVPLSRDAREQWVDAYLQRAPPERRPTLKRSLLQSEWLPAVAPAYGEFQIDRLGFVWVPPHVIGHLDATASVEWSVFGPDGAFVATVMLAGDFRPTEIGEDYLLGVSTDEMDVERVHRYELSR